MSESTLLQHDTDPIVNISQDYIEHLTSKKKRAANALSTATSQLAAATKSQSETQVWKTQIETYWKNVKETNAKYKSIKKGINGLKKRADVVTSNADALAESIEILVCIVRRMANRTEDVKDKLKAIKAKIAGAEPNDFTKQLTDFETGLDDAIKTNNVAIQKVLDVLAAAYRLHISILGEKRVAGIKFPIDEKYLRLELKGPDINLNEFFVKNRGLKSNLDALLSIFTEGSAYHIAHDAHALCPTPLEAQPIRFSLEKYDNPYFELTKNQFNEADEKLNLANERLSDAEDAHNARKAADDALQLSLDAALAAKNSTK